MKRGIILAAAVWAAWWGGANFAAAQFGVLGQAPIRSHPSVSPYINMGVGGGGALGYYGLVRPQTEGNKAILDMQANINRLNPDGSLQGRLTGNNAVTAMSGLYTGHATTYFNTGHYFPVNSPGGSNNASGAGFGAGMGSPGTGMGGFNSGGYGGGAFGGAAFGTPRPFYSSNLNAFPR